jgi:hypothetical protein
MHNVQGVFGMGTHQPTVRLLAVFLVLSCLGSVSARLVRTADDEAEGNAAAKTDVLRTVQDAKGSFQPISLETVSQAKSKLEASIERLGKFLADELGDADRWKTHLMWAVMTDELAKEKPNLAKLDKSLSAFHENEAGLEAAPFLETRALLRTYMNAALYSGNADQTKQAYITRMDDLAKQLESYAKAPKSDTAVAIGRHLGWFDRARQSPQVITAVREQYSHPNLLVEVSHGLFSAGIDDNVEQSQQVTSYILGTSIRGTAIISGRITSVFVPDPDRASFDLLLKGNIFSDNVGTNGPVTIYSTANTSFDASKRVHFDATGFLTDSAVARCITGSNVKSIAARSCLVRKIAWKRVAKNKTKAERLASGQAQRRVAGNFDEQTAEMLAEPETGYTDRFRKPLIRRGGFPAVMKLSTTLNRLTLKMMQESSFQLAAPSDPPTIDQGHDLAVRVHESLIGNFSESLLGGVTITDEEMVSMYVEANREVPKDMRITNETEPWAITFARTQPIRVRFQNGSVHIEVHCQSLHRGENYPAVKLAGEIRISADYKLDVTSGGIQLVRPEGDVQIDFLKGGKVVGGIAQAAQKGFLKSKFNSMLKTRMPEEASDGINLQGQWARAGKLVARETKSVNGWLVLGLAQVAPEAAVAAADSQPTESTDQPEIAAPAVVSPPANETAGIE